MGICFYSKWDCVFRHQLQHHDEDIKQCWRFKPVAMYSARSMPRYASRRQRLRRNRLPTPLLLRMRLRKEQRILKIQVNLVIQFGNFKANAVSSAGSGGIFLSSSKHFGAILDPIFWVELQVGERSSKGREKRKGEGAPGKPSLFCIATLTRLSAALQIPRHSDRSCEPSPCLPRAHSWEFHLKTWPISFGSLLNYTRWNSLKLNSSSVWNALGSFCWWFFWRTNDWAEVSLPFWEASGLTYSHVHTANAPFGQRWLTSTSRPFGNSPWDSRIFSFKWYL